MRFITVIDSFGEVKHSFGSTLKERVKKAFKEINSAIIEDGDGDYLITVTKLIPNSKKWNVYAHFASRELRNLLIKGEK